MAYQFLKYLFKFAQFFYFKKIEIVGQENIPKNEANIFVSNHPSAFKDPILVSVNLSETLYYISAEEFMGPPKVALFLEKNLNIIPIYRPQTRPDELHKNNDSFRKSHEALRQKKSIAIYAEGFSETRSWLAPIKSGTARIAFEALDKFPEIDKVNIISMGYNYSNPHQFRSTFLLNIEGCIEIKRDHNLKKSDVSRLAFENINKTINALEFDHYKWQEVLQKIFRAGQKETSLIQNFKNEKLFINSLNSLKDKFSSQFDILKTKVVKLQEQIDESKIKIDDLIILMHPKKINILSKVSNLLIMLPGFILNIVPLYFTNMLVTKRDFKYSFEGSMKFGFGTLFNVAWHVVVVIATSFVCGWFSLLSPLILLFTGYIALKSWDKLQPSFQYNRLKSKINISQNISTLYNEVRLEVVSLSN